MSNKRIASYVVVFLVALCLGAGLHASLTSKAAPAAIEVEAMSHDEIKAQRTETVYREIANEDGTKFVVKTGPNPAVLTFIFAEPITPDFFVGTGSVGRGYEMFLDDPEYDPLNVGVDYVLDLQSRIRQLPGVTEDVHARGYELSVYIAESHFDRMDEIVDAIIDTINE